MVDLETLSTRMNAKVLVLAAIKFDRYIDIQEIKNIPEKYKFYKKIDINSYDNSYHQDSETIEWWKKQDKNIYKENFEGERISLKQVLIEFSKWFGDSKQIWSNGNSFDIPILSELYKKSNMEIPWKYYNSRDTRTIYELANVWSKNLPQLNLHNALFDCWRQIVGINLSMKVIYKNL